MGVESGFVVVGGGRGSTKRSQRGLVCRIRSGWRHSRSSDRERVVVFAAAKEENSTSSATSEGKSASMFPAPLPVSDIWEIDFYSRPVLGLDGKKLWELIITDKSGNFEHVESVPNSMVNSKELRSRVEKVIADSRVKPKILRFFRAQMQNMIKIALSGIEDVVVTPSRRTYSLLQLIEYRELNVYPNMVGYQASSSDPFAAIVNANFDVKVPEKMPDSLRGEKYAFVSLELGQITALDPATDIGFGELCPIPASLSDDTNIPGICVYSKRASALAGWLSGIELATFTAAIERKDLLLECGLNTNFLFAKISQDQRKEARDFETKKDEAAGLHFLAIQTRPDDEAVAGFWLLRTIKN